MTMQARLSGPTARHIAAWAKGPGEKTATSTRFSQNRVPHLRDGFIVAKVGYFRGSENPDTLNSPAPVRGEGKPSSNWSIQK